jgi:16S rRNA processing protein RimM
MSQKPAPKGAKENANGGFITLARVVKTQGRQGEVAAEVHSDVPDRFFAGMMLFALIADPSSRKRSGGTAQAAEPDRFAKPERFAKNDERVSLEIVDLWPHKGLLVLKFAGIDSIADAEALIGSELQLPRGERAELEAGWTYVSDLVGCTVFDHGQEIGRIEDVQFGAGEAPLLIVAHAEERGEATKQFMKYDVPFAEAYLESVDGAKREVRMNLPDGMLEVNAPMTEEEKKQQVPSVKRKKR